MRKFIIGLALGLPLLYGAFHFGRWYDGWNKNHYIILQEVTDEDYQKCDDDIYCDGVLDPSEALDVLFLEKEGSTK
mgnify:CR=1 FL=1